MGVTQAAFANRIGITTARLSEIVHGKRAVTQDTAKRFAQALGTSFEMWLRMQFAVDVYDAAHAPADKVIAAIKPFNVSVSDVRNGRVRRQQSAYGRKRS
jgi:addiction module HigA family antidote